MRQRLVVLGGAGNVGRTLINQVTELDVTEQGHRNPSIISGVVDFAEDQLRLNFAPEGIDPMILRVISHSRDAAMAVLKQMPPLKSLDGLLQAIRKAGMDGEIVFVDVTAGKKELLKFHKQVITDVAAGNKLVTSNKNPLAFGTMRDFRTLTQSHHRYDANVTVMGGAGALNFINERHEDRDVFQTIEGCFSGTLGYIFSELEKGRPFSEIVKEANEAGYTEPNPWDDLNGLDVARKILILARYAGFNVEMKDVKRDPMIGEKYGKLEGDAFFEKIKAEDERFRRMISEAADREEVVRYVARLTIEDGQPKMTVGFQNYPKDSDFGGLKGTANLVRIETGILEGDLAHIIKSPGAGLELTAAAVRSGITKKLPAGVPRM